MKCAFPLPLLLLFNTCLHGAVLISWEVSDGIVSDRWESASNDPNLMSAPWTAGAGTDEDWEVKNGDLKLRFFSQSSIDESITAEDYFEFTITPEDNVQYSVEALNMYSDTGNGAVTLELRSSLDNYAAALNALTVADTEPTITNSWVVGGTAHENLTDPVSFRLYGFVDTQAGRGDGQCDPRVRHHCMGARIAGKRTCGLLA